MYTEPDYKNSALITIDVQNDYVLPGAISEIKGTYELRANMSLAVCAARKAGIPIIHVVRLYKADGSNADIFRRKGIGEGFCPVKAGTKGAGILKDLLPPGKKSGLILDAELLLSGAFYELGESEWAMYKPRFGAFYGTRLEEFLKSLNINTLVFLGCNFPNCPRTSIYEASERDFKLALIEDAISGIYEKGINELKVFGVRLITSGEWAELCKERIKT
ncbi:MAG: cysteine hydrolase [Lachnospiraceae bacterium]|nr:cysteine hydrolase [Lachnospiraceae bacterium]